MKVRPHVVFVQLTLALAFLLCAPVSLSAQQPVKGVKTIVIDPGHGGSDAGTVWGKIYEKDINLKVALLLGDLIEKNLSDVKVVYTRKTDISLKLHERTKIANKAGADLFVSIHVNAVDKGKKAPSGTITFVMGHDRESKNLDVAMRENGVMIYEEDYQAKYQGFVPGSAESYIMFSLMQFAHQEQSMELASLVQKHYKRNTPMSDMGARQGGFWVLWDSAMPSILTEIGFLPNEHDRNYLTSSKGQKDVATSLFNAISEYKSKVEGNSKPIQIETGAIATTDQGRSSMGASTSTAAGSAYEKIVYRIQVCNSAKKLGMNGALLKQYKNLGVTEVNSGNTYKYYVGECLTYKEAVELQKTVRKSTPDAFMVAFRGQNTISVADARKLTD